MAKLTKKEEHIVEMYVRYFGRVATGDEIESFNDVKSLSKITADIRKDADNSKTGLTPTEFLNDVFQNLFGRDANPKDLKYVETIKNNKNLPIATIIKNGSRDDKGVYNTKKLVAQMVAAEEGGSYELDNITQENYKSIYNVKTGLTVKTIAELEAKIVNVEGNINGKTSVLTEGVDTGKDFIGTNKNDLFIADNSVTVKASAADTLDGGKGEDTFKLYDDGSAAVGASKIGSLPTLKNIENVEIYDNKSLAGAATTVDLTKWDTVETLFLVRSTNTAAYDLGEKVTTVNIEDKAVNTTLNFDAALTAATLGVNKVITAAGATVNVTVDGAALKTLTVDAYGKESNVTLVQAGGAAIETLNITGRADLTLDLTTGATNIGTTIETVDGSKAQGDLTFSNTASMTSIKTGSGNDTVTLAVAVESGETINLGAGNDKLVKSGAGVVDTSTTTVIDGGAGIDSLDSALVTVGNAGVFQNFETLSLTTAITTAGAALDMNLLTKSTITSIAKDKDVAHFVKNVQKSQSLTINTNIATTGSDTTLLFKDVTGTADAYTINFAKDAVAATAGPTTGTVNAQIVTIAGIETVTVNSTGATATTGNLITLNDADAKSLVITGDKALTVAFDTAFGTNSAAAGDRLGVSTIDASTSTAGITIKNLAFVGEAENGLTIKGGAGADNIASSAAYAKAVTIEAGAGDDKIDTSNLGTTKADIKVNAGAGNDDIIVGTIGGTFTLGTGNDTIDVTKAVAAGTTVATGAITTTITDIGKGDVIKGLSGTLFTQATITGANSLDAALLLAANALAAGDITTWFQYAGKTYIVDDKNAGAFNTTTVTGDIVIELNGTVNLGSSTFDATANTLTIA